MHAHTSQDHNICSHAHNHHHHSKGIHNVNHFSIPTTYKKRKLLHIYISFIAWFYSFYCRNVTLFFGIFTIFFSHFVPFFPCFHSRCVFAYIFVAHKFDLYFLVRVHCARALFEHVYEALVLLAAFARARTKPFRSQAHTTRLRRRRHSTDHLEIFSNIKKFTLRYVLERARSINI